jgi:hypothetical protein
MPRPRLGLAADGDEWVSTVPRPGEIGCGGARVVGTGEEGVWRGSRCEQGGVNPTAATAGRVCGHGEEAVLESMGTGRSGSAAGNKCGSALAEGRSQRDGGGKVSMRGGGEVPMRCDAMRRRRGV